MDAAQIKKAVDELFSDTSVPIQTTKKELQEIQEHIEMLLETL